jgi:uncharacterized paraquat-inducible protein A
MFSRRLDQRRKENARFLSILRPLRQKFSSTLAHMKDKEHRYFRCPNCKQQMRVPRGKGRIQVTCRKCGASRLIPTDSSMSAHSFLNADALYLE